MFPHELSGGMKQRACIAIAMSLPPRVIIADEPTSALDVVVQRQVMETLARVQTELGAAVILVGHDIGLMAQFVDRLGVMYAGRLVEVSAVRDVFTAPRHPYTRMLIASLPSLARQGASRAFRGSRRRSATSRPAARSIPAARSRWTAAGARLPRSARRGPPAGPPVTSRRAAMTALLEAREVTKTFGGGLLDRRHTVALRHFSLGLAEGRPSVTAVVGESGSGKTTLARLLLGLLTPTEGEVAYRGRDLAAMSRAEWRTSAARCRRSSRTRTRSTTRSTGSTTC